MTVELIRTKRKDHTWTASPGTEYSSRPPCRGSTTTSPNLDAFATHIGWLAEHGCHGVTPNGSLGEYQLLTDAQRDAVVRTAVAAAPDGLQRHARASPPTARARPAGTPRSRPRPAARP